MRYRKGLINRKIKTAVIELLYVTADSSEIERGSFEVIAHTSKHDKLIRQAIRENHLKYVIKPLSVTIRETLYVMTDAEFIKHAKIYHNEGSTNNE